MTGSPFSEDYLDCLKAQYHFVIQSGDTKHIKSLEVNLKKVGFTQEQLREMYILATLKEGDIHGNLHPEI